MSKGPRRASRVAPTLRRTTVGAPAAVTKYRCAGSYRARFVCVCVFCVGLEWQWEQGVAVGAARRIGNGRGESFQCASSKQVKRLEQQIRGLVMSEIPL